ncbi:SDR family NAD(P)-dependent oxidoreductase [Amaricoccus macauensis]|uniref:SDR family NAD(P)-dependent oxidoreductase n=1 Tax=Amaricoccus macauensis TaxID=57001 RepID=UPI003C7EC8E2
MDLGIDGKLAVISGAGGGLGSAAAQDLDREGVQLFLTDTSASALEETAARLSNVAGFMEADLTSEESIEDLKIAVSKHGVADILVHMAGITGAKGDPLEMTDDDWRTAWETNFMSAVRMARGFVPGMAEKGWGRVVFVTSENAVQPYPDEAVYNASKAALLNFTKALSFPYGPKGVLVNSVMPAFIESPMTDGMMDKLADENGSSREEAIQDFLDNERPYLSLKRRGKPEEVAALVAMLCSARASFTNGSAWRADGGAVAAFNT